MIDVKQNKMNKEFLQKLETWGNEYISKNEFTIVARSEFAVYLKYYNLIKNILDFVRQPQKQEESVFIESCYKKAIEYLRGKKSLTCGDIRAVKEFISEIFKITYNYYQSQFSDESTFANYNIK